MSSTRNASKASSSNFEALLNEALTKYTQKTGKDLRNHPLASKIDSCKSAKSFLDIFQEQAKEFEESVDDSKLLDRLEPVVNGLLVLSESGAVETAASLVFPPAKYVFSAISVLLPAAKSRKANYDALVEIFECIENFLRRLKIYTKVEPTPALTAVVVNIMIELLSVLALAAEQIKRGWFKTYMKTVLGDKKIESVLQRLDRLTQQESQMTVAQMTVVQTESFDVVRGLVDNMKVVMDDGKASTDGIRQALVNIQKMEVQIQEMRHSQKRRDLRDWLSASDPSIKHNDVQKVHHPGTSTWFTGDEIFGKWKSTGSLLWIHGLPGAGKTIMCSTIIENIQDECQTGLAILTFYYFDFRHVDKQDARSFLSSLLMQLGDQSDEFMQVLSVLHSSHRHGSRQPSEDELQRCLKDMLELPGQGELYIVVDALDECQNLTGFPTPQRQVLNIIKELVDLKASHLHLCVTSRFETDIQWVLAPLGPNSVSLHDHAGQKEDIVQYIKKTVESDADMGSWPEKEKNLVIRTLSEKGCGMFRWAQCQLEALRHCPSQEISRTLQDLPKDLNETYERILRNIPEKKWKYAHRIFECLTVSFRQLRLEELGEVFVIQVDAETTRIPEFRPDCRRAPEVVVQSACPSLVAVVDARGDKVAQFSHFSVQEFLVSKVLEHSQDLSKYHVSPPSAHAFFARACLSVLLHLGDEVQLKDFPLASYAAEHWVDHAKYGDVSSDTLPGMKCLFDKDKPYFKAWIRLFNVDKQPPESTTHPMPPDAVPLYYAALCGFRDITEHLVREHPKDVNARGGNHVTPLHAALDKGHLDVALLLLQNGANAWSRGIEGQTPLHIASDRGYVDIVNWLIDKGADLNAENDGQETPLHLASKSGREEVANILLAGSADVNHRDRGGWTPLHVASQKGHDHIVQLLLNSDRVPNVNPQDINHNTPLHIASCHGKVVVVRTLLDHGANVEAQDRRGGTPLHDASQRGHLEVVRLLLERDADSRARNRRGETPFHLASRKTHSEVAQLLGKHAGKGA